MTDFDYGIIGGGPAGYTAGMLLAKQGKKVVLFEKDKLGGTCLNRGCIPTKALLHSSEIYHQMTAKDNYGLKVDANSFDFANVTERRDNIVEKIRKGLELAVKNSGVQVIYAEAEIKDNTTIIANTNEFKVGKIVLATGSKPREVKGLEFDHEFILSSDDVLKLNKLPKSALIIGSGAIGIEWARIFTNFGVDVSIVELGEHLCPIADIEVSKRIERIFKQRKIKFYLNDCVAEIQDKKVTLRNGTTLEPDIILSAVGRVPVETDFLGVKLGDISGEVLLAHYAISQAKEFVEGIKFDKNLVPSVIYGEPEIAWVGLREQDCDDTYEKRMLPITALGKSWCDDATDGFIKLILKDNYIVGAHIVSKEASAMIQQLVIAIQNKIGIDKLKEICVAHPTYSEGLYEILG